MHFLYKSLPLSYCRIPTIRSYTTSNTTVRLSFSKFSPTKKTRQHNVPPLVICHGLFGSKQNWRALALAMSNKLERDVYALDLRNHGQSPHSLPHTYEMMAEDVSQWIIEQGIDKPILLGHSMGGKTVMTLALMKNDMVSKVIVADIAPVHMTLLPEFPRYIQGMLHVERKQLKRQDEIDRLMMDYEPDTQVRQFLLTNLQKSLEDQVYRFRVPVETLGNSLGNLAQFIQNHRYPGPTLFITGGASPYRKPFLSHPELVDQQFPDHRLTVMPGCGHWLHAEKPELFMTLVTDFITTTERLESEQQMDQQD